MTLSNFVTPMEGSPRGGLTGSPRLAKVDPLAATPARLKRPQGVTPRSAKFISLAQYEAGYANRDQWPILWPHLHARSAPRRSHPVPAPLIRPQGHPPTPQRPEPVAAPTPPAADLESPLPAPTPPFTPIPGESPARLKTRSYRAPRPSAIAQPQPQQQPTQIQTQTQTQTQTTQAPQPTAASKLSAWQRVCQNKGVQRALAIGKLAADSLDLLGAMIVAPITGTAIYDVVLKNLKADYQQLRSGKPAQTHAAGTRAVSRMADAAAELVRDLGTARDTLKGLDSLTTRQLKASRRALWCRGVVFAGALFMIAASGATTVVNPVLGGVGIALSVYAARQAYANWRLARENLENLHAGLPTSPMGNNALAHVLNQAYLQERPADVSPSEIQARAARSAAIVGVASIAASAAVGGLSIAAGAALPALLSDVRHAVRGVGSVVAPVTEVVDGYATDARVADLAKSNSFDAMCNTHWTTFFNTQPEHVATYQSALGRYVNYQQSPLQRLRPCSVTAGGATMDIGPLIHWTRETRRLSYLQAWLALDAQRTGDPNWAQRVFEDLEVIDGTRVAARGTSVLGVLANVTSSAVSLSQ